MLILSALHKTEGGGEQGLICQLTLNSNLSLVQLFKTNTHPNKKREFLIRCLKIEIEILCWKILSEKSWQIFVLIFLERRAVTAVNI